MSTEDGDAGSRQSRLAAGWSALERSRTTAALFDTNRFRFFHLESTYRTMWETSQRGEPPRSFAVQSIR